MLGFLWFLTLASVPIIVSNPNPGIIDLTPVLSPILLWIDAATVFLAALTILSLTFLLLLVRKDDALNERMDSVETSLKKLTASQGLPKPPE